MMNQVHTFGERRFVQALLTTLSRPFVLLRLYTLPLFAKGKRLKGQRVRTYVGQASQEVRRTTAERGFGSQKATCP